jgi:hypothetical protein
LQLVNPKLAAKKGEKYKNSGTIIFTKFQVRNSFVKLRMWLSYNAAKWPTVLYQLGSLVDVVSNFFSLKNVVPVLSFTKVSVPDPKIFLIDPDPRGQLYSEQGGSGKKWSNTEGN